MKKRLQTLLKISLSAVLTGGLHLCGYSQKLSNVQETSIWAPANIKIDAKLNEWNDNFQAYNKATQLNYTVANDDKNLYLVIKSTDAANNNKIVAGGITFTLNTAGKKKDKDAFAVTFPVISRTGMRNQFRQRGGGGGGQRPVMDSAAIAAARKLALAGAKEITVSGFKDITDTVISIYNEYGIKAAVDYDAKGNFVYELALPLKLLSIQAGDANEIAYNLKLNGIQFGNRGGGANGGGGDDAGGGGFGGGGGGGRRGGGGGGGGFGGGGGGGGRGGGGNTDMQAMMSPTDFWGKYTLAKK